MLVVLVAVVARFNICLGLKASRLRGLVFKYCVQAVQLLASGSNRASEKFGLQRRVWLWNSGLDLRAFGVKTSGS